MKNKLKHIEYDPPYFDDEERDIIEAWKRGEFVSVGNIEERRRFFQKVARNTIERRKAKKPVTFRLSEQDIASLKSRAKEEGMPYQTLMNSIIHKYVTGKLVERTEQEENEPKATKPKSKKEVVQK